MQNGPAAPGRSAWEKGSGCDSPAAAVHHFGFEFRFQILHLSEDGETAGRAAHLALQLAENFVQAFSGGPEGWVVLSR